MGDNIEDDVLKLNVHEDAGPNGVEVVGERRVRKVVTVRDDHRLKVVQILAQVVRQKPANQFILKLIKTV